MSVSHGRIGELTWLDFIDESNRIEGIDRPATKVEIDAHAVFLGLEAVTVEDLERFVRDVAARPLRESPGMDVRVGNHVPPRGGPQIRERLAALLKDAQAGVSPYAIHRDYETLHPFLDGNGRSGRVLWAWMMQRRGQNPFAIGFLHRWYYQSLDGAR